MAASLRTRDRSGRSHVWAGREGTGPVVATQPPMVAASRKIPANSVFGTLRTIARTGNARGLLARSARVDSAHPATHAPNHTSGTSLAMFGGNGTADRYEKYAAPTADEPSATVNALAPSDMCILLADAARLNRAGSRRATREPATGMRTERAPASERER